MGKTSVVGVGCTTTMVPKKSGEWLEKSWIINKQAIYIQYIWSMGFFVESLGCIKNWHEFQEVLTMNAANHSSCRVVDVFSQ